MTITSMHNIDFKLDFKINKKMKNRTKNKYLLIIKNLIKQK